MSLIEYTLEGKRNKVDIAIERLGQEVLDFSGVSND